MRPSLMHAMWSKTGSLYDAGYEDLESSAIRSEIQAEMPAFDLNEAGSDASAGLGCLSRRSKKELPLVVMSLQEVADVLGVSRERVRQLEYSALNKLRAALRRQEVAEPFSAPHSTAAAARVCLKCGQRFAMASNAHFCGSACKRIYEHQKAVKELKAAKVLQAHQRQQERKAKAAASAPQEPPAPT